MTVAKARAEAAETEAKSRVKAAEIYARAYTIDPALYTMLRSFDTLDAVINQNTRLILRTDAAPFRGLVDGPERASPAPHQATAPVEQPTRTPAATRQARFVP